jgi:hypothetical protein
MLGKMVSGFVGARIADEAGKSGVMGAAVGMIATRLVTRSPIGAVAVGGAYLAHRLWKRSKEREEEKRALAAKKVGPARFSTVTPVPPQPGSYASPSPESDVSFEQHPKAL